MEKGRRTTNFVHGEEIPDSEEDTLYSMFTLSGGHGLNPIVVDVNLNGCDTSMIVDIQSSVSRRSTNWQHSVISEQTFHQLAAVDQQLKLEDAAVTLTTYTGEPLDLCGQITSKVK